MMRDIIKDGVDMVIDSSKVEQFTPRHEQLSKWVTLRNIACPTTVFFYKKQDDESVIGRMFIHRYQGKRYKGRLIVAFRLKDGVMSIY